MALPKELRSIKRFGARYGRNLKQRLAEVENLKKSSTKCPYCSKDKVKRTALGIWHCSKCNATFAGRAYTYSAKASKRTVEEMKEAEVEEVVEAEQTEEKAEKKEKKKKQPEAEEE